MIRRFPDRLIVVSLGLAVIVVFLASLQGEFLDWDDTLNFVDNPHYRGLGLVQLRWMFTAFHHGHYTPITWLTLGLDYVVWRMNPFGYHLTSLLLHVVNAVLVYLLGIRLMLAARPGSEAMRPAIRFGAAAGALLFALHPLRVEPVAWVTERREVLCGLLYMCAVIIYLRSWERRDVNGALNRRAYWASVGLFSLALLSKAIAITLPFVLLVLDVYPLQRVGTAARQWSARTLARVCVEKVPFILLSIFTGAIALFGLARTENLALVEKVGWADRFALSMLSPAFYMAKTTVPVGLSPIYERPESLHLQSLRRESREAGHVVPEHLRA